MKKKILVTMGCTMIVILASLSSTIHAQYTKTVISKNTISYLKDRVKIRQLIDQNISQLKLLKNISYNRSWFPGYFFWVLMYPIIYLMKFAIENLGWEPGLIAQAFILLLFFLVYAQAALLIMLGYIPPPF